LLLLLLSGWRYRGKDHVALSVGIGGLSGFCSGLAQTGGPPIVGYWLGRPVKPEIARANIVLFFAASDFFSLVSYIAAGLINADAVRFALLVGPIYAIGLGVGASLFGRASEQIFRAICYALIALAVDRRSTDPRRRAPPGLRRQLVEGAAWSVFARSGHRFA
jgi:hypothetical protein